MADNPDSVKCSWPRRQGAITICGNRARIVVTAPGGTWARAVCYTHERAATRRGWTIPGDKCPDDGKCHHACVYSCFRVRCCGPLSGVYPRNDWPGGLEHVHLRFPEYQIEEIICRG